MRNASIFALILVAIGAVIFIASQGASTGHIEGKFASNINGIDYKWAYLRGQGDQILDSCMISESRFTLSCGVLDDEFPCRITYSGFKGVSEVVLRPHQTIQLAIQVEPSSLIDMIEERIEQMQARQAQADSIARMDSIRRLLMATYQQ